MSHTMGTHLHPRTRIAGLFTLWENGEIDKYTFFAETLKHRPSLIAEITGLDRAVIDDRRRYLRQLGKQTPAVKHLIPTAEAATPITVTTADELISALAPQFGKPGLSTRRAIDGDEVSTALAKLPEATERVRVYSSWGFVPNSYKYRSEIQFVEATKVGDAWSWTVSWGRAQRSNGKASLVVVK